MLIVMSCERRFQIKGEGGGDKLFTCSQRLDTDHKKDITCSIIYQVSCNFYFVERCNRIKIALMNS